MKFEILGFEVHVRRVPTRRWEIQDSDERGYLAWYSGEPYMNRTMAIDRARRRELPAGWRRVVRNVKTGERADFGTPPTSHGTATFTVPEGGGYYPPGSVIPTATQHDTSHDDPESNA